ncbi:CPBP family intramembrane glutamic endopeptidase [Lewinella sp. IMCC34191]|uniref:CPBP family intramembrane glutamic endopeptidase n=1 Tax=Lewinella sp. IMCC34191 TaxID=2259172 RepID=UPI000E2620BC
MTLYLILYAIATTFVSVYISDRYFENDYSAFLLSKCLLLTPVCIALIKVTRVSPSIRPLNKYILLGISAIWITYYFAIPTIHTPITWSPPNFILGCVFTIILVLFEELIFRVLPFKNFNSNNYSINKHYKYAGLFAAAHMSNFLYTGSLQTTINQVSISFGLGLILSGLFIRTKSVILVVLLHFFVNVGQEYNAIMQHKILTYAAFSHIDLSLNASTAFVFVYTCLMITIAEGILPRKGIGE